MDLEVVVLAEDQTTGAPELLGEHGLALLVRGHGRRVLFDTGATGSLVSNAKALGLADDLATIDAVVVSHGHYDHAGGLAAVLEHARRPIPVHVRPGFFRPRLSARGGAPRAIGLPFDRAFLEGCGARFVEEAHSREILPGFWLSGEIPMREEQEAGEVGLMLGAVPEHAVPDPFTDEHALAVDSERGLVVLVGCSHRGLINSILAAQTATRRDQTAVVFGGAHLRSASPEAIDRAVQRARTLTCQLGLGHCTGRAAETRFAEAFQERFWRLKTGWHWPAGL